ncbi:hypothetical protein JTB14_025599, partial [Gonioctena quinquepunctata]
FLIWEITFTLESIAALIESQFFENKMLMLNELNKKVKINDMQAFFEVDESEMNGMINTKNEAGCMNLRKGLEMFFENEKAGIVTSRNMSVAVWKQDDFYYYFDSHNRDGMGMSSGYGTACIVRTALLDDLSDILEANLGPGSEHFYNINKITITFCKFGEGDVYRPPLNHFTKINDNSAILTSLFSEISSKYNINCGKQTIPMCLTALAFDKLKPARDWTKQDLDEILNKGDELYQQSLIEKLKRELDEGASYSTEFKPASLNIRSENGSGDAKKGDSSPVTGTVASIMQEDEEQENDIITLDNVKKDFPIGLNKFQLEFEDVGEGIIKEDLKTTLKSFFETDKTDDSPNENIIVQSKPLSTAVWKDDKVFYVFDPKPRDKKGNVIGMEDWSQVDLGKPEKKKSAQIPQKEVKVDTSTVEGGSSGGVVAAAAESTEDEFIDRDPVTNITTFDNEFIEGEASGRQMFRSDGEIEGEGEYGEEDGEIKYFPVVHKSSSYWREREKSGRACTMWFTTLDDLVEHILNNIPPKERVKESFVVKSIKMTNTPQMKIKIEPGEERDDLYAGDWYDFLETEKGKWIMRGTKTIWDNMFPLQNRGKQSIPVCVSALAIANVFGMVCFNNHSVDSILLYGDKLFTFVKRMRKKQLLQDTQKKLSEDEVDWLIQHEEFEIGDIPRKICISKFLIDAFVEPDVILGDINAHNSDVLGVRRGLEEFFKTHKYGLLQAKNLTVAVWRGEKMFYMFDGLNRGPNGVLSPNGTACITRYLDLGKMADTFLANVSKYGNNMFVIHNVEMDKDLCPREREPKIIVKPPKTVAVGGFSNVMPGKSIVRGTLSQDDPKFGKNSGVMSSPIAIIALTMSLLHKTNSWSKPIIDNILEIGEELYEDSLDSLGYDFNPWEDKLDIHRVKNDYKIGMLKANCELRFTERTGLLDTKDPTSLNLRQDEELQQYQGYLDLDDGLPLFEDSSDEEDLQLNL